MRSLPPFLRASREWQSAAPLARAVWQDVRPRAGELVVAVPAGRAEVDVLASVLGGFGWDLPHADVGAVLADWARVGLVERASAEEGGELLKICATPPSVVAELERTRRGPHGGLTRAEIQKAYREREAARKAAELAAKGGVTGNGDGSPGGNKPGNVGPSASPSPSPEPPKGVQGEGERADGAKTPEAPAEGRRSAAELAALGAARVGALALARLSKGNPAMFSAKATVEQVGALGAAVIEVGAAEVELLAVAAWWRTAEAEARKALSWSRTVRSGGAVTVGLLVARGRKGETALGLRACLEVAVPWAQKHVKAFGPGAVKALPLEPSKSAQVDGA